MPLKKDPSGRRSVELELELPGTPEEIWRVMATGPGYSAWFMPTEIEEREGGAVRFDLGMGITSTGHVTTWQPPHRFAYDEVGWSGDASPLATEVVIEAKAGGTCIVRMVHSLFTEDDDWDAQLESMEAGWPAFFRILRIYLRSFAGLPAATARPTGTFDGTIDAAWQSVQDSLGLTGAGAGDRRDTSVGGAPRLAGIIEVVQELPNDRALTLVVAEPMPGIALIGTYSWGGKTHVAMNLYFYGEEAADTLAYELPKWEAWMTESIA